MINTNESKLRHIKTEINSAPSEGVYKAREVKKERIKYYSDNVNKLERLTPLQVTNYNFVREVLIYSEKKERETYRAKLDKKVKGLERHNFAPELNTLHFKNKTFKTPQKTSIEEAINFLLNKLSLNQLKAI